MCIELERGDLGATSAPGEDFVRVQVDSVGGHATPHTRCGTRGMEGGRARKGRKRATHPRIVS